jgi:hypothetical protein
MVWGAASLRFVLAFLGIRREPSPCAVEVIEDAHAEPSCCGVLLLPPSCSCDHRGHHDCEGTCHTRAQDIDKDSESDAYVIVRQELGPSGTVEEQESAVGQGRIVADGLEQCAELDQFVERPETDLNETTVDSVGQHVDQCRGNRLSLVRYVQLSTQLSHAPATRRGCLALGRPQSRSCSERRQRTAVRRAGRSGA